MNSLIDCQVPDNEPLQGQVVVEALDCAASALGNSRAICRKAYVDPRIIEAWQDGTMLEVRSRQIRRKPGLQPDELRLIELLKMLAPIRSG